MRTLLTTALLLPLLSVVIGEPARRHAPPSMYPAFPLNADRAPAAKRSARVLLMPLTRSAESYSVSSPANGVSFDVDGDGTPEQVAWPEVGADIGFLAVDVDGDGVITSGKELVGPAMAPGTTGAANAILEIVSADGGSRRGSLRAGSALYERLLVWIDRNHNGIGERRELRPARELFTAIGLSFAALNAADAKGNRIESTGWMELRTGGPDQPAAASSGEQSARLRQYFETTLVVRD